MTNATSSSQICSICWSSGSSSCGCNLSNRGMRAMLHISNEIDPVISLSPARHVQTTLQEFQFLPNDNTAEWLFNDLNANKSRPGQVPLTVPPLQYAEPPSKYHNPHRLTLNFCCSSTASSVGSPPESPFDLSVMGQAELTNTAMSVTGYNKEICNTTSASSQVDPVMGREARVLRYKEKKKNRKFVKQVRYASRKAYAEKRPRIKGRFAKRPESGEPVVPPQFNTDLGMGWFHL